MRSVGEMKTTNPTTPRSKCPMKNSWRTLTRVKTRDTRGRIASVSTRSRLLRYRDFLYVVLSLLSTCLDIDCDCSMPGWSKKETLWCTGKGVEEGMMGEGRGDVGPGNGTVRNKAGTPFWLFCDSAYPGLLLGFMKTGLTFGSVFESRIKEGLGSSPSGGSGGAVGTAGTETVEHKCGAASDLF